jgi:hypothetical protein
MNEDFTKKFMDGGNHHGRRKNRGFSPKLGQWGDIFFPAVPI